MTRKELLSLPIASFNEEIPLLDELYFIPTMRKHDSGYRQIEIIGTKYTTPRTDEYEYAKKLATYSDVIHYNLFDKCIGDFSMDVPQDCNCFRLFTFPGQKIKVGWHGLSDFGFSVVKVKDDDR